MDYLKTELLLRQHEIHQTIVVFGSTRICEPAAARRKVETLRQSRSAEADDSELERRLAPPNEFMPRATTTMWRASSAAWSERPIPVANSTTIMTGGGPGMMEAANRGTFDVGAKSVGLNISLPHEQYPNPYITPELCFSLHYFSLRKLHFLLRAKALVAFPGGYGTLDELFEVLTLIQTRKIKPIPVVLVGQAYWRRAVDIDFLVDEGVIDAEDRDLFWFAETAEEIWNGILGCTMRAKAVATGHNKATCPSWRLAAVPN